ncbi:ATP-binding cassette domain-containing protein [Lactobacillus sp. S2-2]|uniref:ABC-F family ATP-binding cassette domain-containing protein n=1 Tax=Lactobacillus sp. S2-2 TaxID=2692917 RepID=UPI001F38B5CE|nr:ABC-F family ATP-binding cassette domain-containing protein [Lactobacillus sp. S2-2]MCF6515026.1 ATP-binding cassette domain-containing protein [Lactobacillus sp. S2-2]
MQTLRANNLTKTYGEKLLFENLDFIINEHDRIGLIGTNGSGKTSLLNVIAGKDHDSSGEIITSKSYSIGYVTQQTDLPEDLTVMDAIFSGSQEIFKVIRHYESILHDYSINPGDAELEKKYMNIEQKMTELDAWSTENEVKTILTQLNVDDLDQKIKNLSGGQRKRVGLAQVLIQSPDLLILDEPTNHLDFDSIEWLEEYLSRYKGALVLVTHDRYFLDQVVNNIWELSFGSLYKYTGNYQKYVEQKSELVEQQVEANHKAKQLYKKELEWMKAGAKARSTKQQARIERFNNLKDTVDNPIKTEQSVDISMGQSRLGKKVIEVKNAYLKIDSNTILKDFNILIQNGQRIGISGENGAGKSSFLNVISNKLPLDSGIVEIGETVKIGYYTQKNEPIPEDKRVFEYLSDIAENVIDQDGNKISVADLLEQFLFPKYMHGTLIRKLSGGERRRLYLLKLLMEQPNVLLLDEPTNNLDIATLTVLENYINSFAGTVITVSHDRYFLDKVADHLLIFKGNGNIQKYDGLFTDYLAKNKENQNHTDKIKEVNKEDKNKDTKKNEKVKLTYAEKIEWDGIEQKIEDLDEEIASIKEQMQVNGADYAELAKLQQDLDEKNTKSDQLMERWEYLSQFV